MRGKYLLLVIQGIWWFVDINASVARLDGYQSLFQLIPRHNSYENTQIFIDNFNTLVTNRVLYAGAALILVFITVIIYEQKRRGKINDFGKSQNSLQIWQIAKIMGIREGNLYFCLKLRKVCDDNTKIELTVKEFDALYLLISNRNRILTFETFARQIWGEEYVDIIRLTAYNVKRIYREGLPCLNI